MLPDQGFGSARSTRLQPLAARWQWLLAGDWHLRRQVRPHDETRHIPHGHSPTHSRCGAITRRRAVPLHSADVALRGEALGVGQPGCRASSCDRGVGGDSRRDHGSSGSDARCVTRCRSGDALGRSSAPANDPTRVSRHDHGGALHRLCGRGGRRDRCRAGDPTLGRHHRLPARPDAELGGPQGRRGRQERFDHGNGTQLRMAMVEPCTGRARGVR